MKHKRVSAKRAGDEAALRRNEERDWFAYPEVTDQDALLEIARRVYEERSRQELEGTLRTAEMRTDTLSGADFDLLTLAAGDVLRVEFEQQDKERLAALGSTQARVQYLVERGYTDDVAELFAKWANDMVHLAPNFFVKRVHTTIATDEDAGTFEVEINFANRIQLDGSAQPQ